MAKVNSKSWRVAMVLGEAGSIFGAIREIADDIDDHDAPKRFSYTIALRCMAEKGERLIEQAEEIDSEPAKRKAKPKAIQAAESASTKTLQ